jgi:hypothetical protein
MPKKCDDPVVSISFGLRKSDVEYIRKNGTGETLGEKLAAQHWAGSLMKQMNH